MKKPIIRIHNTETNEIINREMTDIEYQQHQLDVLAAEAKKAKAQAKADAKAQAKAKLEALGLTVDDLQALGL